jgi:hypothetical protein
MNFYDDFIAENVKLETELWQIVEDHDLFEKQGWINDCMMRDLAIKLENENPRFNGDIVHLMDKLYVACLRRLALNGKEYSKEVKSLVLKNLILEREKLNLESDSQ